MKILVGLAQKPSTLGAIFRKAQNRIQDPAKLKRLIVDLIDKETADLRARQGVPESIGVRPVRRQVK